jgi:hypothetical protein
MPITPSQYYQMLARVMPKEKASSAPGPDRESQLHDQVLEYCHSKDWLCIHSAMHRATTTAKGVSDFIVITPTQGYFLEAKRRGQKLRPEQAAFLAQVAKLGWPCGVIHSFQEFLTFLEEHP